MPIEVENVLPSRTMFNWVSEALIRWDDGH
jgi:hypothetical protein